MASLFTAPLPAGGACLRPRRRRVVRQARTLEARSGRGQGLLLAAPCHRRGDVSAKLVLQDQLRRITASGSGFPRPRHARQRAGAPAADRNRRQCGPAVHADTSAAVLVIIGPSAAPSETASPATRRPRPKGFACNSRSKGRRRRIDLFSRWRDEAICSRKASRQVGYAKIAA